MCGYNVAIIILIQSFSFIYVHKYKEDYKKNYFLKKRLLTIFEVHTIDKALH